MEIKLKINKFINKIKECPIFKINLKKIFSVLFLLVFVWIIAMCLIDANYKFNPILLMCGIAFSIIILCAVYKKIKDKYKNITNKSVWIFYCIIVSLMIILQFIIGYLVRTNPSWDLGLCIQSANEIIENGHSTDMAVYYIQAPNNIFITLMLTVVFKIFSIVGISNTNISTLIANIFFIQLAVLFLFKTSKRLFGNITACFTLILMFLFLPIYPYSTIMYTDTTSMFIPIALLYLIIKTYDNTSNKKKYLYDILIGCLMFISFKLKVTALIVIVAFVIIQFINKKIFDTIKILLISGSIFIILNSTFVLFLTKTGIMGIPMEKTKEIPYTHFIMMGMYDSGAFSADEWQFTLRLPDYETRQNENIRVIKNRLKTYKTQGYIKFLNNKIKGQTWGSGTYDFEGILNSYNVDNNIAHKFLLADGEYYQIVYYYCQIYHFTMLICIAISIIYTIKNSNEERVLSIAKLSIFGLLIFLLIWETRSRYMLNFIPIYILVFVSGINYFEKDAKKFLKRMIY